MMRIVIENIILFLLPSVAYFTYVYLRANDAQTGTGERADLWSDAPIVWLMLAGALLMLAVTFTFATFEGGKPGQTYIPPHMQDGEIVPGHFE